MRRVDRIGRDIVPVMIWLKVPGVVRPYLWGVGGMTIDELNDYFIKLNSGDMMDPLLLQRSLENWQISKKNPSMYAMVCWMARVNPEAISFHEFIKQAAYFFSQR